MPAIDHDRRQRPADRRPPAPPARLSRRLAPLVVIVVAIGRRDRDRLASAALVRDAGPPSRGDRARSSRRTSSRRSPPMSRSMSRRSRCRSRADSSSRSSAASCSAPFSAGAAALVGRDHRARSDLPDRQERVRRIPGAPGRSAGGEARGRLSRRCVQLSAVPAAGAGRFRSGWSISCRRCAACGLRPSSRRPRSASCRRPSSFAFFGAGLDSVIAAQEAAYRACLAAGRAGLPAAIRFRMPRSRRSCIAALVALGVLALVPGRGETAAWRARDRPRDTLHASLRMTRACRQPGRGHGGNPDTRHLRHRRRRRRAVGRGRRGGVRRAGGADREGQDGRRVPQLPAACRRRR